MSIQIIVRDLVNHHCHISKNVIVTSQDIADEDYKHAKRGRI